MKGSQWLSVHLFYEEPFEFLLSKGVKPFVEKISEFPGIEGYFFIRYWEKGPHIRLRIKGNPTVIEREVKPRIKPYFNRFMNNHPSKRREYQGVQDLSKEEKLYPNNTVEFIDYEPEIKRYGGKHLISVAEDFFKYSSEIVLNIIDQNTTTWNYNKALGIAIQLHLSFSHSVGMDVKETYSFFNFIFNIWIPKAKQTTELYLSEDLSSNKKVVEVFKKSFEKDKEKIVSFIRSFWKSLDSVSFFQGEWLESWIQNIKDVHKKIDFWDRKGKIEAPFQLEADNFKYDIDKNLLTRWTIYQSFIHMTNNRLGIRNRDEGYLGFLIKEGIQQYEKF